MLLTVAETALDFNEIPFYSCTICSYLFANDFVSSDTVGNTMGMQWECNCILSSCLHHRPLGEGGLISL